MYDFEKNIEIKKLKNKLNKLVENQYNENINDKKMNEMINEIRNNSNVNEFIEKIKNDINKKYETTSIFFNNKKSYNLNKGNFSMQLYNVKYLDNTQINKENKNDHITINYS